MCATRMIRLMAITLTLLGAWNGRAQSLARPTPGPLTSRVVAVIGNPYGDGGGTLVYGNGRIVRIPPWSPPDVWRDLFASLAMLDHLEAEQDPLQLREGLERQTVELATQVRRQLAAQQPLVESNASSNFTRPGKEFAAAIIFMSPGVSSGGGGWVITAGGKVHKIDPRGPPSMQQLFKAAQVLQFIPALSANGPSSVDKPQPDPWKNLMTALEAQLKVPMQRVQAEVDALP